jgi:uroporphyrinogen decarboxylase
MTSNRPNARVTRRDVVLEALAFRPPPYVPWAWDMTQTCHQRLAAHLGADDLTGFIGSHFLDVGSRKRRFAEPHPNGYRDAYGVVFDTSVDKDIGTPCDWPLKDPRDLERYTWPDPNNEAWYAAIPEQLAARPDLFSRYRLGFSLYERAWTMRGMTDLLMDMIERPEFVERLLDEIVEHNLAQIRRALALGVEAVFFGDDYGSQAGLIMGREHWRHFFKPRLARMFAAVRDAGRCVCLHSCGCVAELFDELVEIGLNVFNPFQPEVMDIFALKKRYQGRLAFHGGMSIQRVLPFGTPEEVRHETRRLVAAGCEGGYIFAPSHSVPPDVPPANLVAMMDELRAQPRVPRS